MYCYFRDNWFEEEKVEDKSRVSIQHLRIPLDSGCAVSPVSLLSLCVFVAIPKYFSKFSNSCTLVYLTPSPHEFVNTWMEQKKSVVTM